MAYVDGFLVPVPVANKDAYLKSAQEVLPLIKEFGVARMVETMGDDVPHGEVTDMYRAVKANEEETVAFSWFEYPDKADRDATGQKMMSDPRMEAYGQNMPFDGKRMVYGGFEVIVDEGSGGRGAYLDGSVAPALESSREVYQAFASRMAKALVQLGALRVVDAWSQDLQVGKITDFRMAVNAEDGEAVVFSWIEWPSKAVRDEAWDKVMNDESLFPQDHEMHETDNRRRIFGGFTPILDA